MSTARSRSRARLDQCGKCRLKFKNLLAVFAFPLREVFPKVDCRGLKLAGQAKRKAPACLFGQPTLLLSVCGLVGQALFTCCVSGLTPTGTDAEMARDQLLADQSEDSTLP